jgi:hypothetical protein
MLAAVAGVDDPRDPTGRPARHPEAHAVSSLGSDAATATATAANDDDDDERGTHTTSAGDLHGGGTPPALRPGDRLGRYVLLDMIGAGGMSVVYRAVDPELARHVAIKILRRGHGQGEGSTRERWRGRLLAEAQAMAKLQHPNVIAVHDVGAVGDDVFIAMELIAGQTLAQWTSVPRPVDAIVSVYASAARGLAAAHAAGLVHRDFKPSNVMVGDDGRVRVLDFGVARTAADREDERTPPRLADGTPTSSPAATPVTAGNLTQAGSLVGTPGYMAPEQATGTSSTVACDQFSFAVALYEALWDKKPFPPRGRSDMRSYIGQRRAVEPPRRGVPARLRRAIMRALEPEPTQRHPAMESLIAALDAAVAAKRRRRLALAAAATVLAAATLTCGSSLWQRHTAAEAARQREASARSRLDATEVRVAELTTSGRVADADSAFLSFARLDEHRGTDALALGWQHRAGALHDQGRHDEEVAAWASAWGSAPGPVRQAEALLGLAGAFHRRWDWVGLDVVLARLGDDGLDAALGPASRGALAPLTIAAHLARRDLGRAAAELATWRDRGAPALAEPIAAAPVIAALAHAVPTGVAADGIAPVELDGAPAFLVLGSGGREVRAVRADLGLTPLWTAPLLADGPSGIGPAVSIWPLSPARGELLLLALHRGVDQSRAVLYRVGDGGLHLEASWPENTICDAAAIDIDGDGRRELLVGTGHYSRHLLRIDRTAAGWAPVPAYPDTGAEASDVLAVLGADLDGDRRDEIVLSIGPWHAYDVRVVAAGSAGLVTQARHELGTASALEAVTIDGRRRIAAAKSDLWPSKVALPDDDHYGAPAGIHVLAWQAGKLSAIDRVSAPRVEGRGRGLALSRLVVGDLDGDGRDDLVATTHLPSGPAHALIARQQDDGHFATVLVGGLDVQLAAELDGDPGVELVVRFPDDPRLWILGAGTVPVPPAPRGRAVAGAQPRPPADERDPAVARMWTRGDDLAAMGLAAQAAEVFDQIAELASPVRDVARRRAGHLWAAEGELERAAERFEAAGARDAHDALRAAELRLRLHDVDAAAAIAGRVAERADASADVRRAATAMTASLQPLRAAPSLDIAFSEPLSPAWNVLAPEALHRDLRLGALRVDAFGGADRLAELPVVIGADWIRLSVELDVARTEWGSGVEVALVRGGSGPDDHVGVGVAAYGGGGILERRPGCLVPGTADPIGPALAIDGVAAPASLVLTVDYVPSRREAWCTVADRDGRVLERRAIAVRGVLGEGPRMLVVRRGGDEAVTHPMWASAAIRRIAARGLRALEVDEEPLQRAHRLLVEGDAGGALAVYEGAPAPTDASWVVGRIEALDALGRRGEAAAAARAAARSPVAAAVERSLWHLVRTNDRAFAPIVHAMLGRDHTMHFVAFWYYVLKVHLDDRSVQELVTGSAGTAPLRLSTPPERHAAAVLLAQRGDAWWRLGHFAAVRADLEQAITLGTPLRDEAPPPGAPPVALRDHLATAHVVLAAVAAAGGDEDEALAHARSAMELGSYPDQVRDHLAAHAELAARRGRAGWEAIFPP